MYFFLTRWKFFLTTTVYNMYLCAETECGSCSIHGYITTTDNDNFLSMGNRGFISFLKCFHEVVSCQEFVCREYSVCLLARDSHETWKSCSGTDKYSLKAFLFHQLIDLYGFTDDNVGLDIHTECFYVFYLGCYNLVLWKTELRNTVA